MAKAPIWPVSTDALIADTTELTVEEFGAYTLLMIAQWRSGGRPLPKDHGKLARMARCTPKQWERIWSAIGHYFDETPDGFSQKRVLADHEKVSVKIDRRREAGKAGGNAKALNSQDTGVANASDLPEQTASKDAFTRARDKNHEPLKEDSEAKASGAGAPPTDNPIKALFDLGIKFLEAEKPSKEARTLIGKWRSQLGDDELFKILLTANNKLQIERVPYIFGAVKQAKLRKEFGMGYRPLGVGG